MTFWSREAEDIVEKALHALAPDEEAAARLGLVKLVVMPVRSSRDYVVRRATHQEETLWRGEIGEATAAYVSAHLARLAGVIP